MHPDIWPGKPFPNLALPDQGNQIAPLSERAGGRSLIVVFYRGFF